MKGFSFLKGVIFFLIICFSFFSLELAGEAQEAGKVNGKAVDKESEEPLPGITVTVEGTDITTFTDEDGAYMLELEPGTYTLRAEMLGYETAEAKGVVIVGGIISMINFNMEEVGLIRGEEVVVSGERLAVPLSKTTASVSVVTADDAKKIGVIDNAADMLMYTPGVQMETGDSGITDTIKIRGQAIAPPKVSASGILLVLDGVPMNEPLDGAARIFMIPAESIERIEVLKGASSAQYGGQASAGVIRIFTKKGSSQNPRTSFSMNLGTYQRRQGAERELMETYSFSHSWGWKWFDYSISGNYTHRSGFTTAEKAPLGTYYKSYARQFPDSNFLSDGAKLLPDGSKVVPFLNGKNLNKLLDEGDRDKTETYAINASLGFKLFKNNQLRINPGYSFLLFHTVPSTPNQIPLGLLPKFFKSIKGNRLPKAEFLQFLLEILNRKNYITIRDEWKITPKLTYEFIAGANKSTDSALFIPVNDRIIFTKEQKALGLKDRFIGEDPDNPFAPTEGTYISKNWSISNNLSYDFDILDGNTLSVGQEYLWEKSDAPLELNNGLPEYIKTPTYRNHSAIYFSDLLKIKDLSISLGGRWDQVTHFIEDFDDEVSPRFGLNYQFTPGTSVRFSVGRARRFTEFARTDGSGQSNGLIWGNKVHGVSDGKTLILKNKIKKNGQLRFPGVPAGEKILIPGGLGPEITWSYELGFRFLTKHISGDIAYFYNDYSDLEINVPINQPVNHSPIPGEKPSISHNPYLTPEIYAKERYGFVPNKELANSLAHTFISGPDAAYQGFETSFEIIPLKNLNLNLSYVFTRAIVGNPNPFDFSQGRGQKVLLAGDGNGVGFEFHGGDRLVYVPTHQFKASADYTLPFGLRTVVSGRYKSDTGFISGIYQGIFNQPEHWIWDFKMSQPLFNDKLRVTFGIDNVFSKLFYENGGIPSSVAFYTVGLSANF